MGRKAAGSRAVQRIGETMTFGQIQNSKTPSKFTLLRPAGPDRLDLRRRSRDSRLPGRENVRCMTALRPNRFSRNALFFLMHSKQ
jgi:hypothetical protein